MNLAGVDGKRQLLQPLVELGFGAGGENVRLLIGQPQLKAEFVPPHVPVKTKEQVLAVLRPVERKQSRLVWNIMELSIGFL